MFRTQDDDDSEEVAFTQDDPIVVLTEPENEFGNFMQDKTQGVPLSGSAVYLRGNIEQDLDNLKLGVDSESLAFLGVAYVAALTPHSTIGHSFANINNITITVKYPRGYGKKNERGADKEDGDEPRFLPSRANAEDYGEYGVANIHLCPEPDAIRMYNVVVRGHSSWKQFYLDFLAAYQTKSFTARNVKSYFAWKKINDISGEVFAKNFSKITGGAPIIMDKSQLRAMVSQGKWIEYRTTFASTTRLFQKMFNDVDAEYVKMFSKRTKALIDKAVKDYWDEKAFRAIPEKALAILYAYLKATDQVIPNLYAAEKAFNNLSLSEKISLDKWFKESVTKLKTYDRSWDKEMPHSLKKV